MKSQSALYKLNLSDKRVTFLNVQLFISMMHELY